MQGFGQQPPGGPLGDPLNEGPLDPLNEPLDPFTDQFDPMLNLLEQNMIGGGHPLDPLSGGGIQDPLIETGSGGMDSIGKVLGDAKANIDNPSSMPLMPEADRDEALYLDQLRNALQKSPLIMEEPDDLARKLERLEENIENLPPEGGYIEPEIPMPQQNCPVTSGKGTDDTPPLPYYLEDPQQAAPSHTPPHRPGGRIGRLGGRDFKSSQPGQSDKKYCPIEDDYVSQDSCEDKDCKYYVKDSDSETAWRCTYHDEEES